jgi:hypothetical protein
MSVFVNMTVYLVERLNEMTKFNEFRFERYAVLGHPTYVLLSFLLQWRHLPGWDQQKYLPFFNTGIYLKNTKLFLKQNLLTHELTTWQPR